MKIEILDQQHPERRAGRITRCRALAEGAECWEELKDFWFPQNAKEPSDLYEERKKLAVYHNYAGPIVGLLSAYLFKTPPSVDAETTWSEGFLEDVDRRGTSWDSWWATAFLDAITGKRSLCWVNLPARGEAEFADRAAEETAGVLDAYLVNITAEELLDWGEDEVGKLTWVMIRQVVDRRSDVEQGRTKQWRWTHIDATQIRRWTWNATKEQPTPQPGYDAVEEKPVVHKIGCLPVVRLEPPNGLWAMSLLHDPAVAHLRARNDLTWALHKSAHALMYVKRKWDGDDPTIGPGYYLPLEVDDEVGWTEPPGNSFQVLRDDVMDLRTEIYRVVNQMALAADNNSKQQRASGESKQADWQAGDIVMGAYATLTLQAMRDVFAIVAAARGDADVEFDVRGLDGWQQLTLDEFLANSALAINAAKYSPTFRREVAKREVEQLMPDLDEATSKVIRDEIDAAPDDTEPMPDDTPGGGKPPPE